MSRRQNFPCYAVFTCSALYFNCLQLASIPFTLINFNSWWYEHSKDHKNLRNWEEQTQFVCVCMSTDCSCYAEAAMLAVLWQKTTYELKLFNYFLYVISALLFVVSINILISSPQQTGSCLGVSLGTPSATLGQSWRPGAPCHSSRSSSMRRPPSRPYLASKQSWADSRASNWGSRRFHNQCPYYGF